MIYSSIRALDAQCTWPEAFRKAFAFLKNSDLEHMEVGRYCHDPEADNSGIGTEKGREPF